MAVKNRNRNRVETRLTTLTTAVGEYALAFGADEECVDTIRKGVGERQIIGTIMLYYYRRKECVGRVIMKIDWKKHQILVNSDHGDEFHFNTDRSILEQLDNASQEIIRHVKRLRKECHVTRIKPVYTYRAECVRNSEQLAEVRKFLGLTAVTDECDPEETPEFKTYIRFVMDKLKELEVIVES